MDELKKAIVELNKSRNIEPSEARTLGYDSKIASEILTRVISGEGLLDICKEEGKPSILVVRMWERKYVEFRDMLAVALRERGRSLLERRAGLLKRLEDQIMKGLEKTNIMDLKAMKEYMTFSEKLSAVHDSEQDVAARRSKSASGDDNGGGIPVLRVVNPFANKEEVDIDAMKVENNEEEFGDV